MRAGRTDLLRALARRGTWLLLVTAIVLVAGSASAATSTKFYDATIGTPTAPWSVSAGATATFTLTLQNDSSSTQTLGSADFWIPQGWALGAVQTPTPTSNDGHNWTIGTQSSVRAPDGTFGDAFTFRANTNGDALSPSASVTATVQTTVSCTSGLASWQIQAKQANFFSGPPGNDFQALSVHDLTGTVGAGGGMPDHLEFTTQPGDAGKAPAEVPDVRVTVFDTCGNVATGAAGNAALALVQPSDTTFGGGGVLGGTVLQLDGTVSQPVSSGVATFGDLTVSKSGQGYALDASYPGLDTVRSNTFSVYDFYGSCSTGCGTSDDTTSITLNATNGGNGALSLKAGSNATCNGLEVLGSAFTIVPPAGHATYDITFVLTINKRGLQGIGVSNIVVCKNNGLGTELRQLGKCPKKGAPSQACIVSQTSSNAGDARITMLINSTDPGGAGFG